jgi:pimeloyl-ACP methyl ester carboxylesterase
MFEPLGVERKSVLTSLGTMVYYTPTQPLWRNRETDRENLPKLVFLHGFEGGSSAYEWSKVYPAFATEYNVIAPDLIGCGRSEHPERNYVPDDYIKTIIEFLAKTCTEPTDVISSSLTAAFTIRAAIARPDLIKSLILTTVAGLSDFGSNYTSSFFAQLIKVPVLDKFFYNADVATENSILSFLRSRYGLDSLEMTGEEYIHQLANNRYQEDTERAALQLLNDFRKGLLGTIPLELPPNLKDG